MHLGHKVSALGQIREQGGDEVTAPLHILGTLFQGDCHTGKTFTAQRLAHVIQKRGQPMIIFDFAQDWAEAFSRATLLWLSPGEKESVRWNILAIPSGFTTWQYIDLLANLLANRVSKNTSAGELIEFAGILKRLLRQVYAEANALPSNTQPQAIASSHSYQADIQRFVQLLESVANEAEDVYRNMMQALVIRLKVFVRLNHMYGPIQGNEPVHPIFPDHIFQSSLVIIEGGHVLPEFHRGLLFALLGCIACSQIKVPTHIFWEDMIKLSPGVITPYMANSYPGIIHHMIVQNISELPEHTMSLCPHGYYFRSLDEADQLTLQSRVKGLPMPFESQAFGKTLSSLPDATCLAHESTSVYFLKLDR